MPSSAWSSDVCSSDRSEEHTSELQSPDHLVCRLLLEKKKKSQVTQRNVNQNTQRVELYSFGSDMCPEHSLHRHQELARFTPLSSGQSDQMMSIDLRRH